MKNTFIAALLTLSAPALAQVPQWALHPEYSSIKLLGNEHYVVSKNGKYGILRKEAAKSNVALPIEYDSISVFKSHHFFCVIFFNFVSTFSSKRRLLLHYSAWGNAETLGLRRYF